ncbi:MAG: hypothetical protein Q8P05_00265 [Candidatus Diapherotrites archaeon]|nr:hypothetical protein [Candidatus Diapherotrites archaeon]MDZ4256564.1 hypothetical protein [archaeon]
MPKPRRYRKPEVNKQGPRLDSSFVIGFGLLGMPRQEIANGLVKKLMDQGVTKAAAKKQAESFMKEHYDPIRLRHPRPRSGGPHSRSWD